MRRRRPSTYNWKTSSITGQQQQQQENASSNHTIVAEHHHGNDRLHRRGKWPSAKNKKREVSIKILKCEKSYGHLSNLF